MSSKLVLQSLNEFKNEPNLFLAVSGGLDSIVLMHGLAKLGLSATVLHVNHGLRGKESDADENFTKREAQKLGLEFASIRLDWMADKPTQNECRKKREVFFREKCQEGILLFAHHADDQAETIFQRVLRGTGLDGLSGIKKRNGFKVRPFLQLTKDNLRKAALDWNIEWREDSSNASSKYERNWIRNIIFPQLENRKPGFKRRLCALGKEASGLTQAGNDFSSISLGDRSFYRISKFTSLDFKRNFQLSRNHAEQLEKVARLGQGRLTAQKEFWLSCGILMVQSKKMKEMAAFETVDFFESPFGRWVLPPQSEGRLLSRSSLARGDTAKKILQESSVPIFFRECIPFFIEGKELKLLTPKSARQKKINYLPSELGTWFFNASKGFDGRVVESSNKRSLPLPLRP